jgi:hypothetical protein
MAERSPAAPRFTASSSLFKRVSAVAPNITPLVGPSGEPPRSSSSNTGKAQGRKSVINPTLERRNSMGSNNRRDSVAGGLIGFKGANALD